MKVNGMQTLDPIDFHFTNKNFIQNITELSYRISSYSGTCLSNHL